MSDGLIRERRDAVLVLRLDRPEVRNALDPTVMSGLAEAVIEAETDPDIRVILLTASGEQTFCAGMDLKAFAAGAVTAMDPEVMAVFSRMLDGNVAVPLVGGANGTAVGGGLELLLGCDLVVASSDATFGLPEIRRGLFAGGSGTAIARKVPLAVAMELVLTGATIDAARALEVGLVNSVVAPVDVEAEAMALAEEVAANAPLATMASKDLVRLAVTDPARYDERRDHWRGIVFSSDDAREGATAFMEKRSPVWTGR